MDYKTSLYFLAFLLLVFVFFYLKKWRKRKRRSLLFKADFPELWIKTLQSDFPLYNRLPKALQKQLHGHIAIFLNEKNFVGHHGLEITDEIRVIIAAQACILLLNRWTDYYPHLSNILVYPNAFTNHSINGEEVKVRLGESWRRGPIVLSWQHSKQGAGNEKDGENVVMHEFAHQLDQENSQGDGLPTLRYNNVKQWSTVLSKEFNALKLKRKLRKRTLLDYYGATNPAEFFAVITEHFIEQPKQLYKKHPKLFGELKKYYQINPLEWV